MLLLDTNVVSELRKAKAGKGIATVLLPDGETARAEIHWYEAHGVGRVNLKIKELL